jgi:PAS domain S-box-containing protein
LRIAENVIRLKNQSFPRHPAEVECSNLSRFALPVFSPGPPRQPFDLNFAVVTEDASARTVMNQKIDRHARDASETSEKEILFTLDLAGNLKSMNSVAQQLLGYTTADICGVNIGELVAPGFVPYLQDQIARAVAGELGAVYQIEIYKKDRDCLPLEISMRLVNRNGSPIELEGIAFPLIYISGGRPRCLDEEFWIGPGLNGPTTLTFLATR